MSTITVEQHADTWMIVVEVLGHSLFFAQSVWWFTIDEYFCSVAMFQMALFSFFYHLCVLNIAPDPSHVAFLHGLDYTGIFGLTNAIYFEAINLPFVFAGPLWMLLQTFAILGNWMLYNTGYLVFGALLSYAVVFGVTVLHKQHSDAGDLPWIFSLKYWYLLIAAILLLLMALTALYLGGNPGDGQYELVHGGIWHSVAQPPLALAMIAIRKMKAKAWWPFFFVFQSKAKKQ